MAKFVPDVKTQRWIIISQSRNDRPDDFVKEKKSSGVCVFCSGNERLTPPEIKRIGDGERDKPGWRIRVIPNKFPITDIHEVIIHSPDHVKDIADFETQHVVDLLSVYRERFAAHVADGQVMIFNNHGEHAGASLNHPHSQLVVIPRQINLDAVAKEPVNNIVEDNTFFTAYCPDFSQWPYEVWIGPKKKGTMFCDITDEEITDLAPIFMRALKRLVVLYDNPSVKKIHSGLPFSYNFYIHHAKDWFIRIIPRLVHRAGFELGTGFNVNVVDPSIAAEELTKLAIP